MIDALWKAQCLGAFLAECPGLVSAWRGGGGDGSLSCVARQMYRLLSRSFTDLSLSIAFVFFLGLMPAMS